MTSGYPIYGLLFNGTREISLSSWITPDKRDNSRDFKKSSYKPLLARTRGKVKQFSPRTGTNHQPKIAMEAFNRSTNVAARQSLQLIPKQFKESTPISSPLQSYAKKSSRCRMYRGCWYADVPTREKQLESVLKVLKEIKIEEGQAEEACVESSSVIKRTSAQNRLGSLKQFKERSRASFTMGTSPFAGSKFTNSPTPSVIPKPPRCWTPVPLLSQISSPAL